jgi:hypothetical protein
MKTPTILGFAAFFLVSGVIAAQQSAAPPPPPNVLVIDREYLKPGKSGSLHVKSEAAFVKAMTDARSNTHYIAMDSVSGPSRALFFIPYDSFDAWGKDMEATNANASLSDAMDQANIADGELLIRSDSSANLYHPEYSLHAGVDIPHMRYFEITRFVIKSGHEHDWDSLVKIYTHGYSNIPEAHWATFESMYGEDNGGVYLVINPMRSLNEVDKGLANAKQFQASLGESGMKNAAALAEACIQSVQTNLFVINPKMSYASDDWAKSDPSFWGQH